MPYSDLDDPQSRNLYSYVRNNPLSRRDLDGHDEAVGEAANALKANGGSPLTDGAPRTGLSDGTAEGDDAYATYLRWAYDPAHSSGLSSPLADPNNPIYQAQQQSGAQASSNPGVVTGAAADHQREILLGLLDKLVPGDKSLDKMLGSDRVAHGGNCTFSMDPFLKKEVNAAMGAAPDFAGSTSGAHSREGFSPSLHHNHDGNEPDRLHIDHFNGRSVLGFIPHLTVDVFVGTVFYGSNKVFSY